MELTAGALEAIATLDHQEWTLELDAIESHFESYGPKMPPVLFEQLARVRAKMED